MDHRSASRAYCTKSILGAQYLDALRLRHGQQIADRRWSHNGVRHVLFVIFVVGICLARGFAIAMSTPSSSFEDWCGCGAREGALRELLCKRLGLWSSLRPPLAGGSWKTLTRFVARRSMSSSARTADCRSPVLDPHNEDECAQAA